MSDKFDVSAHDESQAEDITNELLGASKGSKKSRKSGAQAATEAQETTPEPSSHDPAQRQQERRSRRRALISAPVRIRQVNTTDGGPDEISTTLDVSRSGILFVSSKGSFAVGMEVAVTFPYSKSPVAIQAEQNGCIARISAMPDGRRAIAVALNVGLSDEMVDASGRKLVQKSSWASFMPEGEGKPLVLAVDADAALRDSLKTYLTNEGYEVIAVPRAREAHEVLESHTPSLLISEIEGDDLPGYDLCAHVKATPRLRTVPVMLMTRSAYPSDYANAHSLGAVVCMAKPYRQERLGHVVRLLAPPPQANEESAPRAADPSRKTCAGNAPPKGVNAAKKLFRRSFGLSR